MNLLNLVFLELALLVPGFWGLSGLNFQVFGRLFSSPLRGGKKITEKIKPIYIST